MIGYMHRSVSRRLLAVGSLERTSDQTHLGRGRILRSRLADWLRANHDANVRFICGPPGSGKSVVLEDFATVSGALRLAVERGETIPSFCDRLAAITGLRESCAGHPDRLRTALALQNAVVAIDDADLGSAELGAFLSTLFEEPHEGIQFVVAARSRSIFKNPRSLVDGRVARLPAIALNFTISEIAQLCDDRNVSYTSKELGKAFNATGGWTIAIAACVRFANPGGSSLTECLNRWRAEHSVPLYEYVRHELRACDAEDAMLRLLSSERDGSDIDDLARLERAGLFVEYVDGRYAVMQTVRDLLTAHDAHGSATSRSEPPILNVSVLGEIVVSIAERRVAFVRRRDAQIFKYVLLKPTGRVSRSELLAAFWPNHERQSALAGLRTACSNIRQALRDATSDDIVGGYFTAEGDLSVIRNRIILDLDRFTAHVSAGDLALATGDVPAALAKYEAAHTVYRGALSLDVPNAPYRELAEAADANFEHASRQLHVLGRLVQASESGAASSSRSTSPTRSSHRRTVPGASSTTAEAFAPPA